MTFNREEAAKRAEAARTNIPGFCQGWVRGIFDVPAAGDFDGDGSADAEDGWKMEPASAKHTDRHPPRGVPVSYLGGSHDNGHRAVSLGHGMIRSTDAGGVGHIATVPLNWPEVHWGLTYAGWSTTCDAVEIPLPPPPPPPRVPHRRFFHVAHGQPYHLENSLRGIRGAILKAFGWIDLDTHPTSDGHLVITHWPRPMIHDGFHDTETRPAKQVKHGATVEEMTLEEVKRLRTDDRPPYRISEALRLVEYATTHGVNVELELKSTAITKAQLVALRAGLSHPERVQVKALPDFYTALKGAHAAGFQTIILGRNARIPTAAQKFITYRRGPVRWI